jgi:transcriptional regulator with XRE-family HTH domain
MKKIEKDAESAAHLGALQKALNLTQTQFAEKLRVKQGTTSRWLAGDKHRAPSSEAYCRMAKLATYPDSLWFWERAGVDQQAILSTAENILRERGAPLAEGETIRVQRFRMDAQGHEENLGLFPLPGEKVVNPLSTKCLVIDENLASRWAPYGSIVALDTSQKRAKDLVNQNVLILANPDRASGSLGHVFETFMRRWRTGVAMGRLLIKQVRYPEVHSLSEVFPISNESDWVLTLGPIGDVLTEWQPYDEALCVGSWSPRLAQGMAAVEAEKQSHELVKKLAYQEIEVDPPYQILGRLICWFSPLYKAK